MYECRQPNDRRMNRSMDGLSQFPIAMVYVPWQRFSQTYELSKGLCAGTIFPELNKPFCGKRGVCK